MKRSRQPLFGKGTFLSLLAHAQRLLLEDSRTPVVRANRRERSVRAAWIETTPGSPFAGRHAVEGSVHVAWPVA